MRLVVKQSGRFTYLYAIKGYRTDEGKSTTKVVEKFGTVEELREKLGGEDPIEWARAKVAEMTAVEKREVLRAARVLAGTGVQGAVAACRRVQ